MKSIETIGFLFIAAGFIYGFFYSNDGGTLTFFIVICLWGIGLGFGHLANKHKNDKSKKSL